MLPKTHKKEYMVENVELFDWELTDNEMKLLSAHPTPAVAGDPDGSSGDCKVL